MYVMDNLTKFSGKGGVIDNLKISCEYFSLDTKKKRRRELKKKHGEAIGSYIITDINGRIANKCEQMLIDSYDNISLFNLIDFSHRTAFNPLDPKYFDSDADIISLASVMVDSVIGSSTEASRFHPFDRNSYWRMSAKSLLAAFISYVELKAPYSEMCISTVLKLIEANDRSDGYERTAADILFERLKEENPDCLAVKQYEIYKASDIDKLVEINDYLHKLLYLYNNADIFRKTSCDTIDIELFTSEPSVLFVAIPDFDDTYRPFVEVMYHQLIGFLNRERWRCGEFDIPVITYI